MVLADRGFYEVYEDSVEGIVPIFRARNGKTQILGCLSQVFGILKIININVCIALHGISDTQNLKILQNRSGTAVQGCFADHVLSQGYGVFFVKVHGVVLKHGELGIMTLSELLAVSEAL